MSISVKKRKRKKTKPRHIYPRITKVYKGYTEYAANCHPLNCPATPIIPPVRRTERKTGRLKQYAPTDCTET